MTNDIISIRDCIEIEDDPNEKFVFVLAPFDKERTAVYSSIIKPVVQKNRYECKRADDFSTNTNKINEIVRYIWKAEFIIADLTWFKPNVMYELGFSHAMDKEVIMIYEKNNDKNNETKFPFDIQHFDIIIYESVTPGGVDLQNRLQNIIEYVMGKITKTVKSDIKDFYIKMEDNEFKQSIISNFEIRKKRISYFTDHVIRNLIHFRNQHYQLEKLLEECVNDTNEKNIRHFTSMAETMADFNMSYNLPFTQHLLNNSANFIANPWIVNKFLDYFGTFQLGLNAIKNISIYSFNDFTSLNITREHIQRNITDLNFCIDVLNEERKMVYLEVIDKE